MLLLFQDYFLFLAIGAQYIYFCIIVDFHSLVKIVSTVHIPLIPMIFEITLYLSEFHFSKQHETTNLYYAGFSWTDEFCPKCTSMFVQNILGIWPELGHEGELL